jgi:hypothetical protein
MFGLLAILKIDEALVFGEVGDDLFTDVAGFGGRVEVVDFFTGS